MCPGAHLRVREEGGISRRQVLAVSVVLSVCVECNEVSDVLSGTKRSAMSVLLE